MARGKLNKLTKAERESQRAGADVLSWVHSGGLASELSSLPFASSLRFPFEDLFVNDALDQCDHDESNQNLQKVSKMVHELALNLYRMTLGYMMKKRMQKQQETVLRVGFTKVIARWGLHSRSLLTACGSETTRKDIEKELVATCKEESFSDIALRRTISSIFDALCDLARDHGRDLSLWGPPCVCSLSAYGNCLEKLVISTGPSDYIAKPISQLSKASETHQWLSVLIDAGCFGDTKSGGYPDKEVTGTAWKQLIEACWDKLKDVSTDIIKKVDPLKAPCAKTAVTIINETEPIDLFWAITLHELRSSDECSSESNCWAPRFSSHKSSGCESHDSKPKRSVDGESSEWQAAMERLFHIDSDVTAEESLSGLINLIKKAEGLDIIGNKSRMTTIATRGRRFVARAIKDLGQAAFSAGSCLAAVERFTWAIGYDPDEAVYPIRRAMCLLKMQCWAQAESDCNVSIALASRNPMAYFQRGVSRAHQGRDDAAKSDFQQAIRYDKELGSGSRDFQNMAATYLTRLEKKPDSFKKASPAHMEVAWADAWHDERQTYRTIPAGGASSKDSSNSHKTPAVPINASLTLEDVAPVPLSIMSRVPELKPLYTSLITGKAVRIPVEGNATKYNESHCTINGEPETSASASSSSNASPVMENKRSGPDRWTTPASSKESQAKATSSPMSKPEKKAASSHTTSPVKRAPAPTTTTSAKHTGSNGSTMAVKIAEKRTAPHAKQGSPIAAQRDAKLNAVPAKAPTASSSEPASKAKLAALSAAAAKIVAAQPATAARKAPVTKGKQKEQQPPAAASAGPKQPVRAAAQSVSATLNTAAVTSGSKAEIQHWRDAMYSDNIVDLNEGASSSYSTGKSTKHMPPPPLRVDTQAKAGSSKQVAAPAAAAFSSPSQSSSSHPSHAGPSSSSPRSSLSPVTPVKRQRQFSSSASMSTSPPTTDASLTTAATSTSAHASMHAHNKVRGHDVPPPKLDTFTWRASDGEAAGETFRTLAPAMRPYPMGSADALRKTVDTQALWQQQLMEQVCFAWMFIRLVRARLGWEHEGKRGEKRQMEEQERKVKMAREGRGKEPQGLKKGFLVNKRGVKTKAK